MGSVLISRFQSAVVVTLHGNLDVVTSLNLAAVLRDLIDGQGNLAVVVDLRDVHGLDRAGIDVLAAAAGRIASRGGELRLGGPTGVVFDVLALAGLGRLVNVPFEQTRRPWGPDRGDATSVRRADISAHPAGTARRGGHQNDRTGDRQLRQ
jgi:anti-sigma B factor antagonist